MHKCDTNCSYNEHIDCAYTNSNTLLYNRTLENQLHWNLFTNLVTVVHMQLYIYQRFSGTDKCCDHCNAKLNAKVADSPTQL